MAKREPIDKGTDNRYVRRDQRGRFRESDELVEATREQTAAIERQTAVIERSLTFLAPAAAVHNEQNGREILRRPTPFSRDGGRVV